MTGIRIPLKRKAIKIKIETSALLKPSKQQHSLISEEFLQRVNGGLGIEGVKDGLNQEQVNSAIIEGHLVIGDATESGILNQEGR